MQLLQQEYKNFEQKQKEISVPQDSIPDFSDPKVKQAWVIFQELLKEKCLPPQLPQQPIQDSGVWYYQIWFHPESDQFYQDIFSPKIMINNPPMNPFLFQQQRLYMRFNSFRESFNFFCFNSNLNHQNPNNLKYYQQYLHLCRKNNIHPDDKKSKEYFKKMMNNQDFNFSEEIKPLEEIKQSKNNNEQPKGLIPRREGTLFFTENEIK